MRLDAYKNRIVEADLIPSLVSLDLSRNCLVQFPKFYEDSAIEVLDLSYNQIDVLPPDFQVLQRLRLLNLSGNRLRSVESLSACNLEELYLDENLVAETPVGLSAIQSLRAFWAANNPFGELPRELERLTASNLVSEANTALEAHITGGPDEGKRYFQAANFFFDFLLAVGGISGVCRLVDLYYKRFEAALSAVITSESTT